MARAVRLTEAAPCFRIFAWRSGVSARCPAPAAPGARSVDVVVAASPVLAPGTKSAESETTSAAMRVLLMQLLSSGPRLGDGGYEPEGLEIVQAPRRRPQPATRGFRRPSTGGTPERGVVRAWSLRGEQKDEREVERMETVWVGSDRRRGGGGGARMDALRKARSRGLQQEFGSSSERTMARAGDRGVAEADLMERRERVSASTSARSRGPTASLRIGVDEGAGGVRGRAVGGGHGRGRADPAGDGYARLSGRGLRRRAADVSVEHPDVVENYRSAHPSRSRRLARIRTGTPRRSARRWSTTVRCSTSSIVDDAEDRRN